MYSITQKAIVGRIISALGATSGQTSPTLVCDLFTDEIEADLDVFTSEISGLTSRNVHGVSPSSLSKIWTISETQAKATIECNTQLNRQASNNLLSWQLSTNNRMLRYKRIKYEFYSDTILVSRSAKSIRGYSMIQLFVSDKVYMSVYLMKSKSDFPDALHQFCKEVGVPHTLVVDPTTEKTSK